MASGIGLFSNLKINELNIMNNFDIIYYINLEYRTDRKEHIISELSMFDNLNIVRVNAIKNTKNGAIGCSKSHILALEHFTNTKYNNCLILEDDFEFTNSVEFVNEILNSFFKKVKIYDVLMLSSNTIVESETNLNFITKIHEAGTASGYSIHRNFVKIFLENFKESLLYLEQTNKNELYSIDVYWKKLQHHRWYCLKPKIGKQIKSYSDTCNLIIEHGV